MNAFALIRVESDIYNPILCEVYLQKEDAIKRLQELVEIDIKRGWQKCGLYLDDYVSLFDGYTTRHYTIERTKIKGRL